MCERRKKIKLEKVGVKEKKTEWVYEENIRKRESEVRGEIERESDSKRVSERVIARE